MSGVVRYFNTVLQVMEVAWSVLWNITDETPEHSLVFLNNNGMDLFLRLAVDTRTDGNAASTSRSHRLKDAEHT